MSSPTAWDGFSTIISPTVQCGPLNLKRLWSDGGSPLIRQPCTPFSHMLRYVRCAWQGDLWSVVCVCSAVDHPPHTIHNVRLGATYSGTTGPLNGLSWRRGPGQRRGTLLSLSRLAHMHALHVLHVPLYKTVVFCWQERGGQSAGVVVELDEVDIRRRQENAGRPTAHPELRGPLHTDGRPRDLTPPGAQLSAALGNTPHHCISETPCKWLLHASLACSGQAGSVARVAGGPTPVSRAGCLYVYPK